MWFDLQISEVISENAATEQTLKKLRGDQNQTPYLPFRLIKIKKMHLIVNVVFYFIK